MKRYKKVTKVHGKYKCPFKPSLKGIWGKEPISLKVGRLLEEAKTEEFNFPESINYQTIEFTRFAPGNIDLTHPYYIREFGTGIYDGKLYTSENDVGSYAPGNWFMMNDKGTKIYADIVAKEVGTFLHCYKPEVLDILKTACPVTCNTC